MLSFSIATSGPSHATPPSFGDRIASISVSDQSGGSSVHFSHDGLTAYVLNGGFNGAWDPTHWTTSTISVINTVSNTVTKTFSYPGIYPDLGFVLTNDEQYFYFSDNGGSNTQGSTASAIYKAVTNTGVIVDTITLSSGANPDQMIATNNGRYLWILETGLSAIIKIDTTNNQIVGTTTLPETSNSMTLSSDGNYIFAVSRYSGTVFKIQLSNGSIVSSTSTTANCNAFQSCGVVSVNGQLWFSGVQGIYILNESSNILIDTITAGGGYTVSQCASYIAASYDGSKIFVTDMFTLKIQVFDTASKTYLRDISATGGYPLYNLAISPDGSTLWSSFGGNPGLVLVNYVGTPQPIINTWGSSNSQSDPVPNVVVIPDPAQRSKIDSTTPEFVSTETSTTITINGKFVEVIRNIQVNGANLSIGKWSQTPTSVTFILSKNYIGKINVFIFNGAVPVLQLAPIDLGIKEIVPAPVRNVRATYISCSKSGRGTRIAHGINPTCPKGFSKV